MVESSFYKIFRSSNRPKPSKAPITIAPTAKNPGIKDSIVFPKDSDTPTFQYPKIPTQPVKNQASSTTLRPVQATTLSPEEQNENFDYDPSVNQNFNSNGNQNFNSNGNQNFNSNGQQVYRPAESDHHHHHHSHNHNHNRNKDPYIAELGVPLSYVEDIVDQIYNEGNRRPTYNNNRPTYTNNRPQQNYYNKRPQQQRPNSNPTYEIIEIQL